MNTRRIVCALALPAFPGALLAGSLVSPTDSTNNAVQLHVAAAHGSAWAASAIIELVAAALMPFGVAGLVHAVRGRGAGLATAGGGLGALGTVGMAAIAFRHVFIYGMAAIDHVQALHALDRVDHVFGPVVFPLMLAGPIAFIVLTAAAARAQLVSRWLIAATCAFVVSDMLPIPEGELVQGIIGIAAFTVLARAALRVGRPDRAQTRVAMRPASAEV